MRKLLIPSLLLAACTSSPLTTDTSTGTTAAFDLAADLAQAEHFYDFPYPSDLRLSSEGAPDLRGFPNPGAVAIVEDLRAAAVERKAFPVLPVAYFRFSAPLAKQDPEAVIPAAADAPVLLVDIDPESPDRGALVPTVIDTPEADDYVPVNALTVAARPGFVLVGGRTYAVVIKRELGDAAGKPLGVPAALASLRRGRSPGGALGAQAVALYAPLWETLVQIGVDPAGVAAATVFTTTDVVADLQAVSEKLLAEYRPQITGLHVDADDGDAHARYCELAGEIAYPQFQRGEPPFNKTVAGAGRFELGADGLPKKQRDETAPVAISLPRGEMPAGGYPLVVYVHGSGGYHNQVIDRGTVVVTDGEPTKGEGPAHVVAAHGIAAAGSAMPVNPERLPGADDIAYLNLDNVGAFPDTFRQGAIEQRMFLNALLDLRISKASVLAGACTDVTLPAGETALRFDPAKLAIMGQSMGGMYTNVVGAIEPRYTAAVPTGAGGYWGYFILKTSLVPGAGALLKLLLKTDAELSFMHPAMHLLETAWEPAEPLVYMPRLARRPLAGHPARSIYEPAGKDDSYFPTVLYDAVALAYGHPQAGDVVWPSMQEALVLGGLEGLRDYPLVNNLTSVGGEKFTGAVVQYEGDGIYDPHAIFAQLDAVKYQYGCFLETFFATGDAKILAPRALGSACE